MRRDGVDTAIFLVSAVILGAMLFFVEAWALMLIAGGLHHEVSSNVPAVSYSGACLVTLALTALVSLFRSR